MEKSVFKPNIERLEYNIDREILHLDRIRREALLLDEELMILETQRKQSPHKPELSHLPKIIQSLNGKLSIATRQLNQLKTENISLRSKIDSERLAIFQSKQNLAYLQNEIEKLSGKTFKTNRESQKYLQNNQKSLKQLSLIRSKSVHEKSRFRLRVKDVSQILEENRLAKVRMNQEINSNLEKLMHKPLNGFTTAKTLGDIIDDWKEKISLQRKVIEDYLKSVNRKMKAFNKISKATGIFGLKEILSTFIRSEEQQLSMNKYLNELNSEIESLIDVQKSIENSRENERNNLEERRRFDERVQSLTRKRMLHVEEKTQNLQSNHQAINKSIANSVYVANKIIKLGSIFNANTSEDLVQLFSNVEDMVNKVLVIHNFFKNRLAFNSIPKKRNDNAAVIPLKEIIEAQEIQDVYTEDHFTPKSSRHLLQKAKAMYENFIRDQRSKTPNRIKIY